jgi:formylmethanofuran dehydrogenase subunit E
MEKINGKFSTLLDEAVAFHGHLCAGQIIGVRIAMLGLRELGITDPKGKDRKRLIVFVEIDRCATDAIMTVTGCRIGRRNMKVMDYGKMAATFLDVETGRAVRIVSLQTARERAAALYPDLSTGAAQMKAYRELNDCDLFQVQNVAVSVRPEDMPGPSLGKGMCAVCGETILDCRERQVGDRVLCRPCATDNRYYTGTSLPYYPLENYPLEKKE